MTKAVLLHKPDSMYDDLPAERYDFPKTYLTRMQQTVGDWVVYYEPRSARSGKGKLSYFATAQVREIIPSPDVEDRYWAIMEPNTFLKFEVLTPRVLDGSVIERSLTSDAGKLKSGGLSQSAFRFLSEAEFATIINYGLPADLPDWDGQPDAMRGISDSGTPFERPVVERLVSRPYRDLAFRHQVRRAYDYRCAMSGLQLRNGGGNPEVEAAHIMPVAHKGPDDPRNGLALSHTLHWMFDRGLIGIGADYSILVSHNKVPRDVVNRLLLPDLKLQLPKDPELAPHPKYLAYHRENIFGQTEAIYDA